jgi:hypothetical protein
MSFTLSVRYCPVRQQPYNFQNADWNELTETNQVDPDAGPRVIGYVLHQAEPGQRPTVVERLPADLDQRADGDLQWVAVNDVGQDANAFL